MAKTIIFYNEWEGINDKELKDSFVFLSDSEVSDLKPGSEIYVYDDFIDPRGKVYGYTPIVISSIERDGIDTLVHYDNEEASGLERIGIPNRTAYKRTT